VHFTGAVDEVPGNSPLVPALTDASILGLRSVKWSPDGSRIAFVATVAFDQAEVDGGQLDSARLTVDDSQVVLLRSSTRFTTLGSFGAAEQAVRGSGADQLSADVRR